jgi:hypothetical protein
VPNNHPCLRTHNLTCQDLKDVEEKEEEERKRERRVRGVKEERVRLEERGKTTKELKRTGRRKKEKKKTLSYYSIGTVHDVLSGDVTTIVILDSIKEVLRTRRT